MEVTISIKGSPQELEMALPSYLGAIHQFASHNPGSPPGPSAPPNQRLDTAYVSLDVARSAISRRPLSEAQMIVLRTLYGTHPNTVSSPDLMTATGYDDGPPFRGLMGAFGRRVSHTEGYIDGTAFFIQEWDRESGFYRYGLPESVRQALEIEGLV